jgi:hypothetical protein
MTARATCHHPKGDTINGFWVCASCYEKLQERPRRYKMVPAPSGDVWLSDVGSIRQEVILSPVARSECGMTFGAFVEAMALRLIAQTRGSFSKPDALDYALEILRNLGEPFGAADYDWSISGAWELVSEDMQYWDGPEEMDDGGNS